MGHKWIRGLISLVAAGVAGAHLAWPQLTVDFITLLALVIGVLPWLQPLFKSVELPGGLKIEFHEMQKVSERARAAGLLNPVPRAKLEGDFTFQLVAKSDPNLALAGLRIELEKRLQALAAANGYDGPARGIGNLLRHLHSEELLSLDELAAIRDLVGVLNEAVHGATVSPDTAEFALDFGLDVLETIGARVRTSGAQ